MTPVVDGAIEAASLNRRRPPPTVKVAHVTHPAKIQAVLLCLSENRNQDHLTRVVTRLYRIFGPCTKDPDHHVEYSSAASLINLASKKCSGMSSATSELANHLFEHISNDEQSRSRAAIPSMPRARAKPINQICYITKSLFVPLQLLCFVSEKRASFDSHAAWLHDMDFRESIVDAKGCHT